MDGCVSVNMNEFEAPGVGSVQASDSSTIYPAEVFLEETDVELRDEKAPQKKPKKVIYFSDGAVELSDDEDKPQEKIQQKLTDMKPVTWMSYIISGLDHMGEKLAWFFGITSPKYQYAIDEYWRRKKEEEEEKEFEVRETAARMERHGRRNKAMDGEPSVSVVGRDDEEPNRNSSDRSAVVTCQQPVGLQNVAVLEEEEKEKEEARDENRGIVNEGFDDSLKY